MPHGLYVIAGPNGAGKSLFSSSLVNVDFEVFDGDKYIARLKMQYPETGSDALQSSVNEIDFKHAKETAIQAKGNFTYETNFSSENPVKSLLEFKAAGYHGHLIFMGMDTVEDCIQRVSIRVKAGGHKVSEDTIHYNYLHGYKKLYEYYYLFDTVTLMDSSIPGEEKIKIPEIILRWKKGRIKLFKNHYPAWIEKFILVNYHRYKK